MTRPVTLRFTAAVLLSGVLAWPACSSADGKAADAETSAALTAVSVAPTAAVEQPITRFIRATGSLMAEDHADVAAEIAGRIVATPIERGTPVKEGAVLVRVSPAEAEAQAREAEANAAQIEARLGIANGGTYDVNAVPEVQTAKSSYDLAQNEFNRIKLLLEQQVVSQSEYDQRRTQLDASRQQYEAARNGAAQQFQVLQSARARVSLG